MTDRPHADASLAIFEEHRRRLFGIAYGMLGSVGDAEDVVQEAYLRWAGVDLATIDSPAAYLTTVTTRLAIDELRSARRRREEYTGPWLPEPRVTEMDPDPADVVVEAEQLSLAMLTAFERLNPVERAVLVLREVFDLDYAEIADIVDKSPANTRQIAVRARERAGDATRQRSQVTADDHRLMSAYLEAASAGDVERLAEVFSQDVVLWADGGGKARAARKPLFGAERVARHLVGVAPQAPPGTEISLVRVNGDPAVMATVDGRCIALVAFEVAEGKVIGVRAILNPDKLAHVPAG
jgi:RNA polymerase sigma-70 factor, ECF subfamily